MIRLILRIIIFCCVFLLTAELFFRTVIHASQRPYAQQDTTFNILHYDPAKLRKGIFSVGRFGQEMGHWKVNNCGWNSIFDYYPKDKRKKPLIALFGDSYMDALLCDADKKMDAAAKNVLNDKFDVYSFGKGGLALSGTIDIMRYAKSNFDPDIYVVLVTRDCERKSLEQYQNDPYSAKLKYTDSGIEVIPAQKYHRILYRQIARQSAIVRYLMFNTYFFTDQPNPGSDDEVISDQEEKEIQEAANYMIDKIHEIVPDKPVIFIIDMNRGALPTSKTPPQRLITSYRMEKACKAFDNCHVLDMTLPFYDYYIRNHKPLNFKYDTHWNPTAYKIAAENLADFIDRASNSSYLAERHSEPK